MTTSSALYLKYRPQNFNEVKGQDHVTKILAAAIENEKVSHAYIFSGERGTGKTTMARIFAKELGTHIDDVIEIDAASNRGIDDIRSLRESVHTLPFHSKHKVYIIDEAHMLTKEAFNALLKTLEEPPAHVIFILATTELHKLLPTVISRCQSFIFNAPHIEELSIMIKNIAEQESYDIDASGIHLIAKLGRGSFRDTQTILQKVFSYKKSGKISKQDLELILKAPSDEIVFGILEALSTDDKNLGLEYLLKAQEKNLQAELLLNFVIESLRHVLLLRFSKTRAAELEKQKGGDYINNLKKFSTEKKLNADLLGRFISSKKYLHYSEYKYLALELAFFDDLVNNS